MSSNTTVGTRLVQNSVNFFFIGNNTFIERKKKNRVQDNEHSGHEKIQKTQAKANRL